MEIVEEKVLSQSEVEERKEEVQQKHEVFHLNTIDVVREFGRHLTDQFDLEGKLKLTPVTGWKELVLDSNEYSIEFFDYPDEGLKPKFHFSFRILVDGKEIGNWRLGVHCELWKKAFFTKQRLDKGADLQCADLSLTMVDVARFPFEPLTEGIDLSQYELDSGIHAGKPVLWKNVIAKPDIRTGKVVDIIAEEGNLRVTAKGLALQNGLVNDFIKIRNLESKRPIEGQIIDENTVKVYF